MAGIYSGTPVKLSNSHIQKLRESFKLHDYDMDGKIFEADVGSCIRSVPGLKPSQHEIELIKEDMARGNGTIVLDELVQQVSQKVTDPERQSADQLAELFRMFDRDGKGVVSEEEVRLLLCRSGERMSEENCEDVIKYADCRVRGGIDYRIRCLKHFDALPTWSPLILSPFLTELLTAIQYLATEVPKL